MKSFLALLAVVIGEKSEKNDGANKKLFVVQLCDEESLEVLLKQKRSFPAILPWKIANCKFKKVL